MSTKTNTETDIEIASLHKKMHSMEEDMKDLIEKNKK